MRECRDNINDIPTPNSSSLAYPEVQCLFPSSVSSLVILVHLGPFHFGLPTRLVSHTNNKDCLQMRRPPEALTYVHPPKPAKTSLKSAIIWTLNPLSWTSMSHVTYVTTRQNVTQGKQNCPHWVLTMNFLLKSVFYKQLLYIPLWPVIFHPWLGLG